MTFDLPAVLAELKGEPNWEKARRNSITLLKQPELRVVLVALQAGSEMAPHRTDSPVTIQVLDGRVTVRGEGGECSLGAGRLLTLWPGVEHAVYAEQESAFLLTLVSEALHPMEAEVITVAVVSEAGA
jgi:quercetin dioxygenase-like cupin family protein